MQSLLKVGHPADREVLDGAGRSLDGRPGKADRPALLKDDAVGANGVGAADDSAQVVGILDTV